MLVGLDIAAIILETNNQNLLNIIDLKIKWINNKKEKTERYQQRKSNLAQANIASGTLSSPIASVYYFLSLLIMFANDTQLFAIGGSSFLFAVLGYFLSLITSGVPLSTVFDCL